MSDAAKHLAMVVKALRAKKDRDGYKLSVRAGRFRKKRHFLVRYGQVLEFDRDGDSFIYSTCYQYNLTEDVPWQEVVACALLLLHHDHTLFDKWRNQRGKRWGA